MNISAAIIALVLFCPLSALIAFFAMRVLVGYRAAYLKLLFSTVIGYMVGISVQVALGYVFDNVAIDIAGALLGWGLMGVCHRRLILDPSGAKMSFLKAMLLVLIQLVSAVALAVGMVLLLKVLSHS